VRRFGLRAVIAALVLVLGVAVAAAQQPAWQSLFDGRSLDGWSGDRAYWSVEDGCIVGRSTAQHPLASTIYLAREGREWGDFELELEFELVGGNSGVQFRSAIAADGAVSGLQADLEDGPSWTGGLYEQDGRGILVRRGEQVRARADGTREVLAIGDSAQLLSLVRVHGWNRYRVVAQGPLVEVYLNGVRSASLLDEDAQQFRASGRFALQLHQGPAMQARFRDLRVRELGAAAIRSRDVPNGEPPHWIWAHAESRDGEAVVLRKRFEVERQTSWIRGSLRADNSAVVSIGGVVVARNDAWWEPTSFEVRHVLAPGPHELVIEASNEGSIGAVLGEWSFDDDAQPRVRLWTDSTWEATLAEGSRARPAHSFGPLGAQPWASAEAAMKGAAKQVDEPLPDPSRFTLPEGFQAQLVYTVPRAQQGSWVSLCRAPGQRMYAGDQYGAIWCITLEPQRTPTAVPLVKSVERVALDISGAQGLVWAYDSLYVVSNSSKSGLYRCRDTNGDGELDDAKLLRAFDGDGEHGPHAVIAGPGDGKLYVMIGNHTGLTDVARSRVPTTWGEDQLLKHRDDPNGHAVGILAPCGWVASCDPDGKEFELIACGFRNSYDIAFDARGELFTYDSDMEWDMGLPWYRPTRLLHIVSGADYGSRNGNAVWPAWVPDSLPATLDLGPGSPTGVLHGRELTQFPKEWRERLYAADWSYGRVWAVDLTPAQPVHRGEGRVFVKGRPLPVTDLEAGDDGTLYITSGGRGTPAGLWRVVWTKGAVEPFTPPRTASTGSLTNRPHALPADIAALRDAASWDAAKRAAFWSKLVAAPIPAALELARDRLRVLQLAWIRLGPVPEALRDKLVSALLTAVERPEYDVNRQALELLCVARHPQAVDLGVALLERAPTQEEQIAYAQALAETDVGWNTETRARSARWIRKSRSYTGGNSFAKFVRGIGEDLAKVAAIPADELRDEPVATAAAAPRTGRDWTLEELEPLLNGIVGGRNHARGRELYTQTTCAACHSIGRSGGSTGPDLTGAGGRFSLRALAENVVQPSRVISDLYRDTVFTLANDTSITGRVLSEDAKSVRVLLTGLPEREQTLDVDSIASRRPATVSRMPENLLKGLSADDVRDLFAYVLAGGDAGDPLFQ
jgi:putative heme-binding domain-containing protein